MVRHSSSGSSVGGKGKEEVGCSGREGSMTTATLTSPQPGARKRTRQHEQDKETSLEHLTQKVQRLHASESFDQLSPNVGTPPLAASGNNYQASPFEDKLRHLQEYLQINQVLKELHFDRLKRHEKR